MTPIKGELTPGIADLVFYLRARGFDTTDSGDGVANVAAGMEGALDVPHVAIDVVPHTIIIEAHRLALVAESFGLTITEQGGAGWYVAATYDPVTRGAILLLVGPRPVVGTPA